MNRLLCPNLKCKGGNLKWITDMEADDLLENGIIECQTCKERYVGIPGWEKAVKEREKKAMKEKEKKAMKNRECYDCCETWRYESYATELCPFCRSHHIYYIEED